MQDCAPLVSVVTICRNAADGLRRTLDSVATQDLRKLEHVIIDGASTDGTGELLARRPPERGRIIRESDRGISHAFNKGIAASSGRWILMLNAGDTFARPDALSTLLAAASKACRIVTARSRCGGRFLPRYRIVPSTGLLLRAHLSHQATLVHRDVYAEYGGYDEAFRIRMDLDFFLRVLTRERLAFVDATVVEFEPGGISGREFALHWSEGRRALCKNRCGPLIRAQYEAFFAGLALERWLRG